MPTPSSPRPAPWEARLGLGLFIAVLAGHLACSLLGWGNAPVDGHEFRQTQTALSIRAFVQGGLRLDYETPLLGKPWAIPLEFPLYQGLAAVVAKATGLSSVSAGRGVGLFAFYLMLPALHGLLGRLGVVAERRLPLLILVLSSPLYLYYSRTILIESTALCLSVWFLWGFWGVVAGGHRLAATVALGCGALGAMVKPTTMTGFLVAAALVLAHAVWVGRAAPREGRPPLWRRWLLGLLILVVALAAGWAWSAYADSVKAHNPVAGFLRSMEQARWGMGPAAMRLTSDFWATIGRCAAINLLSYAGLLWLAAGSLVPLADRRWQAPGALLLCFLAGPLVFANMYRVHDYYTYASGLFLLGAVALALDRWLARPGGWRLAGWGMLAASTALGFTTYARTYYRMIPGNRFFDQPLARAIRAITGPEDVIVIYGQDWNPLTAYYAERRALMFPGHTATNAPLERAALANLAGEQVAALVVTGSQRFQVDFIQRVTAQFDLAPEPLLVGRDTHLYGIAAHYQNAATILRGLGLADYSVPSPHDDGGPSDKIPVYAFTQLPVPARQFFARMSPTPKTVSCQFGLNTLGVGSEVVFSAHPNTELVFAPPQGARRLRAGFGILANAYADPGQATDGVTFSILLRAADGSTTTLATRWLKPASQPADRGVQLFDLELPMPRAKEILLRTGPGAAGHFNFDWAFWSFVTIE